MPDSQGSGEGRVHRKASSTLPVTEQVVYSVIISHRYYYSHITRFARVTLGRANQGM